MSIIFKIIYIGSIVFITLCILTAVFLRIFPLEFTSESYQRVFDDLLFCGIPVAVLLTMTRIGFKKNLDKLRIKMIVIKSIIIAICYIFFSFCYAILSFSFSMCAWSTDDTLFENTSNKSTKIVKRDFGCGATDSSPATVQIFKITQISPLFIYTSKIDTNKLDKNDWVRIRKK